MKKSCENCLHFGNPRCKTCNDLDKYKPDYLTLERENTELKAVLIKCFDYADSVPLNRDAMVDAFGDIKRTVRETGVLPDNRN